MPSARGVGDGPAGEPPADRRRAAALMAEGIVIDGGNSSFKQSDPRGALSWRKGSASSTAASSGWGLDNGYCLMVGGTDADVAKAQHRSSPSPRRRLRPRRPVGAGHYLKMVHNGIEYGMMQAFAEGVEILAPAARTSTTWPAAVVGRRARSCRSWLLDLLGGMERNPEARRHRGVATTRGGGGRSTRYCRLGVHADQVISASLLARSPRRTRTTDDEGDRRCCRPVRGPTE